MFVETTRLIIVFLATAGGFTLAQQSPGDHAILGATLGAALGYVAEGILAIAGLSTRPLVRASPYGATVEEGATLLDTSAVIDGRLLALARAGFLKGAVLVPHFVLDELQAIADAQDPVRRRRGRRGL